MTHLAAPPYTPLAREETPTDYHKLLDSIVQPLPEQKFVGLLACQRKIVLHSPPTCVIPISLSKSTERERQRERGQGANRPIAKISFAPYLLLPVRVSAKQGDPLLRSLISTITSITPYVAPAPPPSTGKPSKKPNLNKPSTTTPSHLLPTSSTAKIYEVETLDSVLFPEGGGQPSDEGLMVPLEGGKVSEGMKVKHVMRRGLRAVHFVEIEDRDQEMLEVGKEVELKVDWERRLDLVCLSPPFPFLGPLPPFPPSPL
jgi:hypothetical protein